MQRSLTKRYRSQYVWQLLGELYCACVIIMVLVKLYNMRKYQEKQSSQQNRNQVESADQHGRSSKRITFVMVCERRSPLKLGELDTKQTNPPIP